jgi:hypothetical protein
MCLTQLLATTSSVLYALCMFVTRQRTVRSFTMLYREGDVTHRERPQEKGVRNFLTYCSTCLRYAEQRRHLLYMQNQNKIVPDNTRKDRRVSAVTLPNYICQFT